MTTYFTPRRSDDKVGVDILLAKLLGNIEAERAVVVVDVPFGRVAEYRMRPVHLLELLRCLRIVWVLVRMVFQRQPSVGLLYIIRSSRFGQGQDFVQGIALGAKKYEHTGFKYVHLDGTRL